LEKALRGSLIAGNSYHVALQPDEATALTRWCRAVAPITSSADAAVFRDAADTIDATE
jgi:mRNA-degrading endonuclease toxin of MazEF toxin-antitoxin module